MPYIEKVQKSKTPLSILLSILELIEKEKTLPKEVQEQVQKEFNKVPINIIMDDDQISYKKMKKVTIQNIMTK